jgi:hypothetical protein
MVLASVGASLAQAADGGAVVPAGGAVAGHGCASWLAAANRIFFADGGSPPLRQTLHATGQAVEFLDGVDTDQQIKCSASPGEPIYLHGIGDECSTIKGDHNGFGTSPAQLVRCARKGLLRGLAAGSHRIRVKSITTGGSQTRVFLVHVS